MLFSFNKYQTVLPNLNALSNYRFPSTSLARKMCKDMAEKKDVPMNTFTPTTDAEYIYAEATDGTQVKIKKSDLFSKLFIYRGRTFDANNAIESGFYRIGSNIQNLDYKGYGILLVFKGDDYILQIYSSSSVISIRKSPNNGGLFERWYSINLT